VHRQLEDGVEGVELAALAGDLDQRERPGLGEGAGLLERAAREPIAPA
jgi:hypothetical protein